MGRHQCAQSLLGRREKKPDFLPSFPRCNANSSNPTHKPERYKGSDWVRVWLIPAKWLHVEEKSLRRKEMSNDRKNIVFWSFLVDWYNSRRPISYEKLFHQKRYLLVLMRKFVKFALACHRNLVITEIPSCTR